MKAAQASVQPGAPLRSVQRFAYAAPVIGNHFFYMPMFGMLPALYAKHFGLTLAMVAAVTLYARVFDGIIDLVVGYLSDRHRARGGSRKVWVCAGALGCIVAAYFLFVPGGPVSFGYYLAWMLVYFIAFTAIEIPHLAWGNELAPGYDARARLFGIRGILINVGVMCWYGLPLLPLYIEHEYTPRVLAHGFIVGAVFLLAGLALSLLRGPEVRQVQPPRPRRQYVLAELLRNRPLRLYFGALLLIALAIGMWFGLVLIYFDAYLGEPAQFAAASTAGVILGTLSIPFWLQLVRWTSKSVTWIIALGLFAFQLIGMTTFAPALGGWTPALLLLCAHICFSCHNVVASAILGDIADYGKLRYKEDSTGVYFAVQNMLFKIGLGVGGSLSLLSASYFEFDVTARTHSEESILGLKLGFAYAPLALLAVAALLVLLTPLSRRRQSIITRRLERRYAAVPA